MCFEQWTPPPRSRSLTFSCATQKKHQLWRDSAAPSDLLLLRPFFERHSSLDLTLFCPLQGTTIPDCYPVCMSGWEWYCNYRPTVGPIFGRAITHLSTFGSQTTEIWKRRQRQCNSWTSLLLLSHYSMPGRRIPILLVTKTLPTASLCGKVGRSSCAAYNVCLVLHLNE